MISDHVFAESLAGLGEQFGIADLALDELGLCSIELRDVGVVTFLVKPKAYPILFATVGRADQEGSATLRAALAGNLLWRETGGATLALDVETGSLVLQKIILAGDVATPTSLHSVLKEFAAQMVAWSSKISATRSAPASDRANVAEDLPIFAIRV